MKIGIKSQSALEEPFEAFSDITVLHYNVNNTFLTFCKGEFGCLWSLNSHLDSPVV